MIHSNTDIVFLDCTLRDGGYYNDWDFSPALIQRYLNAVAAAGVNIVEMGFRFVRTAGFKGPCAFTTDDFLRSVNIPKNLDVAVMLNAGDLFLGKGVIETLEELFAVPAAESPVDIVRFACHAREFKATLPAADWLHERGYRVGFNIMQITDQTQEEIVALAAEAQQHPIEVLYFADSMGSMSPAQTSQIIGWIKDGWSGPVGVHTHDNMGLALSNTLAAIKAGATWVDSTVTGMGRGPGNARTEELALELAPAREGVVTELLDLVLQDFGPMKERHGWGTNPFYYLSGKYSIHPTYIQEMLADKRFNTSDMLSVLDHLRQSGGKKFNSSVLSDARTMGNGQHSSGTWKPEEMIAERPILILGNGSSVQKHQSEIERFIAKMKPVVLGLNVKDGIRSDLIDMRIACHPMRLLADADMHASNEKPLITPVALLRDSVREKLAAKPLLNYGLQSVPGQFEPRDTDCTIPARLVAAYALAVAVAGRASHIYMAGFDGFTSADPRNHEMRDLLALCLAGDDIPPVTSITSTHYSILPTHSVYGLTR
ncbi:aldolase catalytic domain-containing protein [Sulfitobacter sp. CS16]|uniref:aldolase catalytic domain-containing protein n=1 Tax=Sulfitobacter sp. CS16 TaxID=3368573 RepID=UPI00374A1143